MVLEKKITQQRLNQIIDKVLFEECCYRYSTKGSIFLKGLLLDWHTDDIDVHRIYMGYIYESLAKKHNTTWNKVERSIRYAKEMAMKDQLSTKGEILSVKTNKGELVRLYFKIQDYIQQENG